MSLFPYHRCGSSSQPLHPVNRFHCFQETFEILPPLPPFSATATAGVVPWLRWARKIPRLQDLESATTSVKTAAIIHASRKDEWLHRNQKKFQCEQRQHKSVQAKSHKTSTKFKVYQCSLLPRKEWWKQTSRPFTSHHSIPSHLTPSLHQTNLSTGVVRLKVIYSRQSFVDEHDPRRLYSGPRLASGIWSYQHINSLLDAEE